MTERDTRNPQADWNDRDRRDRDAHRDAPRQPQQWHDESHGAGQFGYDDRSRDRDFGSGQFGSGQQGGSSGSYSGGQRSWQDEDARNRRGNQSGSDYRNEQHAYGGGYGSGYYDDRASRFDSFTSEDQGGRDFTSTRQGPYVGRSSTYGYASGSGNRNSDYASGYGGQSGHNDWLDRGAGSNYRPQGYVTRGRDYIPDDAYDNWRSFGEQRGFFAKAGDEVASWFGDEDASRRREQDHRGRGPSNYTRSDERIREDANDALTHDRSVDASHVTVKVEKGEVTLEGTVGNRQAKRRAEDAVEHISGVKHVQNNLRVNDEHAQSRSSNSVSGNAGSGNNTWSAGSGSTTGASTNAASSTASGANKTS